MPGLIDITPAVEVIDVRGHKVHVYGLASVSQFGVLLMRFPALQAMIESNKWDEGSILTMSDEVIASIVAMACRDENEEPVFTEKTAARLSLSEKAEIIGRVWKFTAPKGLGPFIDMLAAFGLLADQGASAMSSPSPSPILNGTGTRKPKHTPQESLPGG